MLDFKNLDFKFKKFVRDHITIVYPKVDSNNKHYYIQASALPLIIYNYRQ